MEKSYRSVIDQSIVLIGFMGVGKTTVGKALADQLGRQFIDVDAELEKEFGMSIPDVFRTLGEDTFRRREQDLTIHFCRQPRLVISLGGGAVKHEKVRETCLSQCFVAYLDMSWDSWASKRLPELGTSRPVLHGLTIHQIEDLFYERRALYAFHHHRFLLDDKTVDETAEVIAATFHQQA